MMGRSVVVIGAVACSVALFATAGLADRQEGKKANKFISSLVGSYAECTAPNDTTAGALPLPACEPAVYQGGSCDWDETKSKGLVKAKEKNGDIKLLAKLTALSNCPDTLCLFADARVTTNQCTVGTDCTVTDLDDFPLGLGTAHCDDASDGLVKIKTTLNTAFGLQAVSSGNQISISVGEIKLGVAGGTTVARTGLLVP